MRRLLYLALGLVLTLSSCRVISTIIHDDSVVASVGEQKLYKSELDRFIPDAVLPEDSAKLAARYINQWAMDRIYTTVAEEELSEEELDVSKELEAYRLSLIKYRYEQRYTSDRLDTLVSDKQINEYYKANSSEFRLSRPIVRFRYIDIMKDSPRREEIFKLMTSSDYDKIQLADTLSQQVAIRYIDSSDTWVDSADLAREFSLSSSEFISKIQNNIIRLAPEDRGDILFAYICDIQREGIAPLEFCTSSIRDIILSKRKHELVKGLEQDLLDAALRSKQFVIY